MDKSAGAVIVLLSSLAAASQKPETLLADGTALAAPSELRPAHGQHSMVFRGVEGESGFNLHSYLQHFDGRFWAMWSSAKVGEEDPDQHVVFATSKDGRTWSAPRTLASDPDGPEGPKRWIARGLFVEGGRLHALAALVESADYGKRGKDTVWKNLRLMRFSWTGSAWTEAGVFAEDCMNNFPPGRVAGEWMMPCRDSRMDLKVLHQQAGAWRSTPIYSEPPFHRMDEPTLYTAADGSLQMIIRDGTKSGRLLRAVSADQGRTWSRPVVTNYPDATSKNFLLRLKDGRYVLINNPDPKRRDPLAISLSQDGWAFSHPLSIRQDAPPRRYEGRAKGSGSFQYPHAIEYAGRLWVIYSTNKEDIEISEFPLDDLRSASSPPEVSVAAYGAKGDGKTLATGAIQKAIDRAAALHGVVVFPPGIYLSGALFLKSHVEFRLDRGVELHAVEDDSAYPDLPSRIGGIEMVWPAALLNVDGQSNVRITGKGVIDGHGPFWWRKFWGDDQRGGMLRDYVARNVRWAVDYDCRRIRPILVQNSRDVQVKDLTIRRSGFWTLTLTYCERVTVDGLIIRANEGGIGPSTDGIDIDSSSNILVQNCDIECNDDNICLKSGRDADGLRVNRPTTNVVIRDCITRAGHGMVTIGSDMSGGVRDVEVYGIHAIGTSAGIRFKSARVRGGLVENIRFRDITMENVPVPFEFNLDWFPAFSYPKLPQSFQGMPVPAHWIAMTRPVEPPERGIPEFRNIEISDVKATGARTAFDVRGHAEKPIRNIRWRSVQVSAGSAGSIRHAADWAVQDVLVKTADGLPVHLEDCSNVRIPTSAAR